MTIIYVLAAVGCWFLAVFSAVTIGVWAERDPADAKVYYPLTVFLVSTALMLLCIVMAVG
jgi:hypothetical protein